MFTFFIANGLGLEDKESKKHLFLRSPFFEISGMFSKNESQEEPNPTTNGVLDEMTEMLIDSVAWTDKLKGPRIIKSHLPIAMLPPNLLDTAKILYVGR